MSMLLLNILRQACKTFDQSNKASFNTNFPTLKQLTELLTYFDIQFEPQEFETLFKKPGRAPCTYVHILENDVVSMSVFVMREGYTMPLHDHPCMHGLLRGIYGKLKVQSYTKQPLKPNEPLYDPKALEVYVKANEPKFVSSSTECATLTPTERNYHEITAVGGVAAFFDILSPPYDADIPIYGSRRCNFYRVVEPKPISAIGDDAGFSEKPSSLCLQRIPTPRSYYCDTAEASEQVLNYTYLFTDEEYS